MYTLSEILKGKPKYDNHNDINIIRSYVQYKTGSESMEYILFELELRDSDGKPKHMFKAIKLYRLIKLPDTIKQSTRLMDIHSQLLSGIYSSEIKLVSIMARIEETGGDTPIGLLQLYGVQGIAETLEEAKIIADRDFSSLTASIQGNYRTMEFRLLNKKESEWLREKMTNMKHLQVVRGIPTARKNGAERSAKGFGNIDTDPSSEETSEQFAIGLGDHEFVAMTLSSPIQRNVLESWLTNTSKKQTYWNSIMQGSTSLSAGINIPIVFAANLGSSLGISEGTSDSISEGTSTSHSVSNGTSYSETSSVSHSTSFSESFGTSESIGVSDGVSTGTSVGTSENFGNSAGISANEGNSLTTSQGTSVGTSFGQSTSESASTSASQGISNSISLGESTGTSQSVSNSTSVSNSASESYSTSNSIGQSTGVSNSQSSSSSVGSSWGQSGSQGSSYGTSSGASQGSSTSVNAGIGGWVGGSAGTTTSNNIGTSHGTSSSSGWNAGGSASNSTSQGTSVSNSVSSSQSTSQGNSFSHGVTNGQSLSNGVTNTQSLSQSSGTSESYSESFSSGVGKNWGVSESQSDSISQGKTVSSGWSEGVSYGQGRSAGQTASNSQSLSKSFGTTHSQSVSNGTTVSQGVSRGTTNTESYGEGTSWGRSIGKTSGISSSNSSGFSSSMGLGASIGVGKSYQFIDSEVQNIVELLEYQKTRLKSAIHGDMGAFFVDMYIATESENAKSAARTAAKFAWGNENAMVCPLQVLDLEKEEEQHLLYHMNAFSPCAKKERDKYGQLESYKYTTILTSSELVAYTHPLRLSDGGIFADIQNIPELAVPSEMRGEIYIGKILSGYRWTVDNGYKTPFDYRISDDSIMHGLFAAGSRSGKTVAALRFVAELANHIKRKPYGKRMRIIAMDPKEDWRKLAKFVEPDRFRIYSMGDPNFFPFKMNPLKVPYGVDPEFHLDTLIDVFCRSYGLGVRSVTILLDTLKILYDKEGVFDTTDPVEISNRSGRVTLGVAYEFLNQKKENKEFGRDKSDAVDKVLDRLSRYAWKNGVLYKLYCQPDGMSIDEILGEDDVVVLESGKIQSNNMAFIFGFITASIYMYAKYHPENFLHENQFETCLVIEEANRVLSGESSNGESGIQGQSIFEEMLDQAAGLGLFVFSITQKPSLMPTSILANSGLIWAGRMTIADDIDVIMSLIGKEGRMDDRPVKKFFALTPTGWFICKQSRTFDYKDSAPVLVSVDRLDVEKPSNEELSNMMKLHQIKKQQEEVMQKLKEFGLDPNYPGINQNSNENMLNQNGFSNFDSYNSNVNNNQFYQPNNINPFNRF